VFITRRGGTRVQYYKAVVKHLLVGAHAYFNHRYRRYHIRKSHAFIQGVQNKRNLDNAASKPAIYSA
jgi:hypothetical protein